MDTTIAFLIFGAGLVGGAMSAIAGGASFITFPALLFAGIPPLIANATNFVGLMPGNVAALAADHSELRRLLSGLRAPVITACLGAGVGSLLLLAGGSDLFQTLVPWLMLIATILFAAGPYVRRSLANTHPAGLHSGSPIALAILFVIAAYGGYFGAGLGVILLAALTVFGYDDIHESIIVKNLLISLLSITSVTI